MADRNDETDFRTAKKRLRLYLDECEVADLERLIRRLNRAPRSSTQPKREYVPVLLRHMSHRDFRPLIAAKLLEIQEEYGTGAFRRSGALKKGEHREAYVTWYLETRANHIAQHAKKLGRPYYERQALVLARVVMQDIRAAA